MQQPSALRVSRGGRKRTSRETGFRLCRKLITSNKLISRCHFRVNCIFTELTGSDGSSGDKSGHRVILIYASMALPSLKVALHAP